MSTIQSGSGNETEREGGEGVKKGERRGREAGRGEKTKQNRKTPMLEIVCDKPRGAS